MLWASPWLNQEHDQLHPLPDGSVYFAIDYKNLVYKSPQDTVVRVLADVPYGNICFAADGSRMLLRVQDPQHDKVVAYDVAGPGELKEAFRRTWTGYFVTGAAVSGSGSRTAFMLQPPPEEPGAHCVLVVVDRSGNDILREDVMEMNPPITFTGEYLIVGTLAERDRSPWAQNRGTIRVYGCE